MAAKVLKEITLSLQHEATGRTRHATSGTLIEKPTALRIVQYDSDPGFYLLYFDAAGCELTDTYHENLEAALAQAEWEFNVKPNEWKSWADG